MLHLFGRPTLTAASGERVELSPTAWRLLAALAAAPREGMERAELAALLLPTGKLSTLRKLVWDLRRSLEGTGLELIEADGKSLRLSESVYCDLRDLRSGRPRRAPSEIYRGPFFEAGGNAGPPPWTAWLACRREELFVAYVSRASAVLAALDVDRAVRVREARHLLGHAPDHAAATQTLMLEGARASDAGEVRRRFGDLQVSLEARGGQPDRRTTDCFYRLVGQSQGHPGAAPRPSPMDLPTVYISAPVASGRSRTARVLRSLLVDITIGLCRASLFRVIAPPARSGGPAEDGGSASRSYVVETSVMDHLLGQQIVFTLVSLPRREILWTEKVDAEAEHSVSAYNLLTAGVLRSLIQRITDVEVEAFQIDADPGAYASYLVGYFSLTTLDLAELRKGRTHLRRSMSQSPDFAPVTSAMARSYQLEWLVTGRGERGLLVKAREHAAVAIASDPLEARGYKALGFSDLFEKRFDAALENYARAEQLNSNYADLIAEHANCMLHCGMLEEALRKIDYAMELNPEFGDFYLWTKASACFLLSHYGEVLRIAEQMRDRDPLLRVLAASHAMIGNREEAEVCRAETMRIYPTMSIAGWTDTIALKDPRHVLHYKEGLSRAGFR